MAYKRYYPYAIVWLKKHAFKSIFFCRFILFLLCSFIVVFLFVFLQGRISCTAHTGIDT